MRNVSAVLCVFGVLSYHNCFDMWYEEGLYHNVSKHQVTRMKIFNFFFFKFTVKRFLGIFILVPDPNLTPRLIYKKSIILNVILWNHIL